MKKLIIIFASLILTVSLFSAVLSAQLVFEKPEYAARRAKLMQMIPDGIAIIQGAHASNPYNEYFQNNEFMYFTGVEIPGAVLIIDGMRKESILFFTISERRARGEGISAELVRNPEEVTGIEKVYPKERFSSMLSRLSSQTDVFYTPFKPEELSREVSNEKFGRLRTSMILNEWDGRLTKELQFVKLLKERFPEVEVKDCSPMMWQLRTIKSPAEIEIMRRTAQIGVKAKLELMRATRVGMHEYEIAAIYQFYVKLLGARDMCCPLIISSEENHPHLHYYMHNRVLEDGDFLVVDGGPNYHHYDCDISISFPANGKFSPRQREIYEAALVVERACEKVYRPGINREQLTKEVNKILEEKGIDLSKDIFKIRSMRPGFGHYVGMAVHDAGGGPRDVLKPGMIFANDRYAVFPDENLGVRVEDTVLITEDGCENLSAGFPRDIDEIEAIMKTKGVLQLLKEGGLYK